MFGPNVYVIPSSFSPKDTQSLLAHLSQESQFSTNRYAVLFMPGTYGNCNNPIVAREGYYEQIAGLGQTPDQVKITGGVYSEQVATDANSGLSVLTTNFWRSQENMQITPASGPTNGVLDWGVSQGASFRRMRVVGDLWYANSKFEGAQAPCAEASGGFTSDTEVTGTSNYCSQQQWYTRNSALDQGFSTDVWNFVFSGVTGNLPKASFPGGSAGDTSTTELAITPQSREKPYLYVDSSGNFNVFSPGLQTASAGTTWSSGGQGPGTSLPIGSFEIVVPEGESQGPGQLDVGPINDALAAGKNVIITPGVYQLNGAIHITNPNTVVLGLGYATLVPQTGEPALLVDDVDGVQVAGLIIDAGPTNSGVLMEVGQPGVVNQRHADNPTSLNDVFFRIGGATQGSATISLQVDSGDVIMDNIWAWRADHGNSGTVGWNNNRAATGVLVNGSNVEALGLAVEHYQEYQTVWNGDNGTTIFYQSELPYDVPLQSAWTNNGNSLGVYGQNIVSGGGNGYPSYYVGRGVCSHLAYGLGVYSFFNQGVNIVDDNAIKFPTTSGTIVLKNLTTVFLNGSGQITHIADGLGATASSADASQPQQIAGAKGTGTCTAVDEPPGSTVLPSLTGISNPNPNNFSIPSIVQALKTPHSDLSIVISHRGLHALLDGSFPYVPENSLQSVGLTAQAGIEAVEIDVKNTADGIPIATHDYTWGREWCGAKSIFDPRNPLGYFDPFTPPAESGQPPTSNDLVNPQVNTVKLTDTRSFFGNTVLRDTITLLNGYYNGCGAVNNVTGVYPPTLADILHFMTKNDIAMVLTLDIKDAATATAAWHTILQNKDYQGNPYYKSVIIKLPARNFRTPASLEALFQEGPGPSAALLFPAIGTAAIKPTQFGSEANINNWIAEVESDPNLNVVLFEPGLKQPNGILSTTVPYAQKNHITGAAMRIANFSPYVEYWDNKNDPNHTTPEFFNNTGYCAPCDTLATHYYKGTPNGQPSDTADDRGDYSFILDPQYNFTAITDDETDNLISKLAAMGKRNLSYLH